MKLDLYLQDKREPHDPLIIEGLEIPDELVGTWNNKRATIEIPYELLPNPEIEFYKGIARLYNHKRKARLHLDPKEGWELLYYFPQKLYVHSTIPYTEIPFLNYTHGGNDHLTYTIERRGDYDYFKFSGGWFSKFYKPARGRLIVWRFYIPEDYPETHIRRAWESWYGFRWDIYPDSTSTFYFWGYGGYQTTNIFRRGYSYLVVILYAWFSLTQSETVFIYRSDGTYQYLYPSISMPFWFNFNLYGVGGGDNLPTFPLEDMWIWQTDDDTKVGEFWTQYAKIFSQRQALCEVELYKNHHDEQVYFVERITREDESGNERRNLITLELSDISDLSVVVAPFTINYKEEKYNDATGLGTPTQYTTIQVAMPTFENLIRAYIYTFALYKIPFDLDWDWIIFGVSGDYTYSIEYRDITIKHEGTGQQAVIHIYTAEQFQVFARVVRRHSGLIELQFMVLKRNGFILRSNWYVLGGGSEPYTIRFTRPSVLIDSVWHYIYFTIDEQTYNYTHDGHQGLTKFVRIAINEQLPSAWNITIRNFDTLVGNTGVARGGLSVLTIARSHYMYSGYWRIIAIVLSTSTLIPYQYAILKLDEDLNLLNYFWFAGTPIAYELRYTMGTQWEGEYPVLAFDVIGDETTNTYKGAVAGKRLTIFTANFNTHTITLDGNVPEVSEIRKLARGGWLASWKNGVVYWRTDLSHNSIHPQNAYYMELGEKIIRIINLIYEHYSPYQIVWETVIAIGESGKVYVAPINFDWVGSYPFTGDDSLKSTVNIFAQLGEAFSQEILSLPSGWSADTVKYPPQVGLFFYPQKVWRTDRVWNRNARIKIGIPIKASVDLWGFNYEGLGYLYITDKFLATPTLKVEAGKMKSVMKWDYYGNWEQGHYRLTWWWDWLSWYETFNRLDGRMLDIQVWDMKWETKYVRYVLYGGYLTGIIWGYIDDVDYVVLDSIPIFYDQKHRIENMDNTVIYLTAKTYERVAVGDYIRAYNGEEFLGEFKIIRINRDNQGITEFTAIKLPTQ